MHTLTRNWIIGLLIFAVLMSIAAVAFLVTSHRINPDHQGKTVTHTGILKVSDPHLWIDNHFSDTHIRRIELTFEDGRKCAIEHIYDNHYKGYAEELTLRKLVGKEITVTVLESTDTVLSLQGNGYTVLKYSEVRLRLESRSLTYLIVSIVFFVITAVFLGCAAFLYFKYRPRKF